MQKVIVFGNSGSGKTTQAKQLVIQHNLAHLDLDTIAWKANITPPQRESLEASKKEIESFIALHKEWVIEGCYADLLMFVLPYCNEMVYLNLSIKQCIENAYKRPFEPHKYTSKEAQDKNLEMLIEWISAYEDRTDSCSKEAHTQLYKNYFGKKSMIVSNQ